MPPARQPIDRDADRVISPEQTSEREDEGLQHPNSIDASASYPGYVNGERPLLLEGGPVGGRSGTSQLAGSNTTGGWQGDTRLLVAEVADEFFAAVVRQAKLCRYLSSDHFSVGGTLLEAWASHESFQPNDGPPSEPPPGRNAEVASHGQTCTNDTHASPTDPEAWLYRKSRGTPALLWSTARR